MSGDITGRLFLVGCPRSGTTLLQNLLAAHREIGTFPSTRIFCDLVPRGAWARWLGLASLTGQSRLPRILWEFGFPTWGRRLHPKRVFVRGYVEIALDVLDRWALARGKTFWLEKTPRHLHFLDEIQRRVERVKFIHLVRHGADAIASLFHVASTNPGDKLWTDLQDLNACVRRWRRDVEAARRFLGRPGHAFTTYEDLVADPRRVVERLCRFIGIEFDPKALETFSEQAASLARTDEPWKTFSGARIKSANGEKFQKFLTAEQRELVLAGIADVDLGDFVGSDR